MTTNPEEPKVVDPKKPDDPPKVPTEAEEPKEPEAPAAIDADAVTTAVGGKKFGWQQAPTRTIPDPEVCMHMGQVQARMQLVTQALGDEWVCTCGVEFVVTLNSGGKKTLKEQKVEPVE